MFKKFLVLCVMLSSLISWSEEKNASDVATNIVSVESPAEIPMSDTATSAELRVFEELALTDPIRALELSMYYQGWGKGECFYVFDDEKSESPITSEYIKNSELTRQIKMRDFDKALKFAEIAFDLKQKKYEYINELIELNIMKLYIMRGEDFAKESFDFFVKDIANYDLEKNGKVYGSSFVYEYNTGETYPIRHPNLYAYFYFKGFGVEKDLEFAKALCRYANNVFLMLYTEKYYFKDLDFIDFYQDSQEGRSIRGLHFLHLIYSGCFDKSDERENLAKKYLNLYKDEKAIYIKNALDLSIDAIAKIKNNYKLHASIPNAYLRKYIYKAQLHEGCMFIRSPFYDPELAMKLLLNFYSPKEAYLCLIISSLSWGGISDSIKYFNEALLREDISLEGKEYIKEVFNKCYNSSKRAWRGAMYFYESDKRIDFNSL